jgi:hypothetical protein
MTHLTQTQQTGLTLNNENIFCIFTVIKTLIGVVPSCAVYSDLLKTEMLQKTVEQIGVFLRTLAIDNLVQLFITEKGGWYLAGLSYELPQDKKEELTNLANNLINLT